MNLKPGTVLQGGRYKIEKNLGQGGFGITYMAIQSGLNRQVAIKEFFMREHCNRDAETSQISVPSIGSQELVEKFRQKFIKEAQMISGYKHPNIVSIYDVFEENGTAYYVMEYHGGGSLSSLCLPLSFEDASRYIRQIASALSYLHKNNTMHLDVKPSNVLLDDDGNAILIDFGVSKRYDESGGQTSSTPVGVSNGYAPIEQYSHSVRNFTPATDIYSLGATFYKLLTGITPPEASVLVCEPELLKTSSLHQNGMTELIRSCMSPSLSGRPQSIDDFLRMLDGEEIKKKDDFIVASPVLDEPVLPQPQPVKPQPQPVKPQPQPVTPQPQRVTARKKKSNSWIWWLTGIAAVAVALGVGYSMFFKEKPIDHPFSSPDGSHGQHGYVDLGLSVMWATCNLGAISPDDAGAFYDGSTDNYIAEEEWRGSWRLPSDDEMRELRDMCQWTWIGRDGYYGYKVTGPSGKSIFLPAAGCLLSENEQNVIDYAVAGFYWSSYESYGDYERTILYFDSPIKGADIHLKPVDKDYLCVIRPVYDSSYYY